MMKRLLAYFFAALPWMGLLVFLGWLLLLRFPLSGSTHFHLAFDGRSPWINTFLPGERVSPAGPQADGWTGQRIFQDPVYSTARLPGAFDDLQVAFEARFTHQPLLELGYSTQGTQSFELEPVWSEALSQGWRHVQVGHTQGFVRADLPDRQLTDASTEHTLVWHATRPTEQFMDTPGQEKVYERSLRGGHDYYFIPTAGEISLKLLLQDMNRSRQGGNFVAFRLTQDDDVLWTDAIGNSGSLDNHPGKVYEKTIEIRDLKPGVYHLAVIADDDIFIRRFSTTARHWVMGPRLYFGDTAGYATSTLPAVAWTNSQHLILETRHQEGVQTVQLGKATTQITRTHASFTLDRAAGESIGDLLFQAPRGDVRLLGDGYFSFDPAAMFLPTPRRLTDSTDLKKEGIESVITDYQPPTDLGNGWKRLTFHFSIEDAKEYVYFVLSAPGILLRQGAVDIRAVDLTYARPPIRRTEWWSYVRRELGNAWHRL